ncbi:hypothetical protein BDW62DRAFT_114823 [Aspergillus aurantiobrunneus]
MPLNSRAVYSRQNPDFVPFASRRSTVHSTNGIVTCTQPLAAAAGQKILSEGGNAAVCLRASYTLPRLMIAGCGGGSWYVKTGSAHASLSNDGL